MSKMDDLAQAGCHYKEYHDPIPLITMTCAWPARPCEYWWSRIAGKWLVADKATGELLGQYDAVHEACEAHGPHNLELSKEMGEE